MIIFRISFHASGQNLNILSKTTMLDRIYVLLLACVKVVSLTTTFYMKLFLKILLKFSQDGNSINADKDEEK